MHGPYKNHYVNKIKKKFEVGRFKTASSQNEKLRINEPNHSRTEARITRHDHSRLWNDKLHSREYSAPEGFSDSEINRTFALNVIVLSSGI